MQAIDNFTWMEIYVFSDPNSSAYDFMLNSLAH